MLTRTYTNTGWSSEQAAFAHISQKPCQTIVGWIQACIWTWSIDQSNACVADKKCSVNASRNDVGTVPLIFLLPTLSVHCKIKMAAIKGKTSYSCMHVSRWSHWKIGDCEQSTLSPPPGLHWYARLLPNGRLGARVTYDLPSDNQNFKQGAWTGA